ncbi:MAG: diguanylate cyclase [Candidatus Sumerlaeia bacterium]
MSPAFTAKSAAGQRQGAPRVLVVADDEVARGVQEALLRDQGLEVRAARNGIEALEISLEWHPQVIVASWGMAEMDVVEFAQAVKDNPPLVSTYVIVLAGGKSEERELFEALERGADDCVIRPFSDVELIARVRVGLRVSALQDQLKQMSVTDPLTGLFNRRFVEHALESEISRAARYGELLCCLMADCDGLQAINDAYGHFCGDAVLRYAATLLSDIVRDSDLVARYGEDEFVVILPKTTMETAQTLIRRINECAAEETFMWDGRPVALSFSIGAAEFDYNDLNTPDKLLRAAERNLAAEKERRHRSRPPA